MAVGVIKNSQIKYCSPSIQERFSDIEGQVVAVQFDAFWPWALWYSESRLTSVVM